MSEVSHSPGTSLFIPQKHNQVPVQIMAPSVAGDVCHEEATALRITHALQIGASRGHVTALSHDTHPKS